MDRQASVHNLDEANRKVAGTISNSARTSPNLVEQGQSLAETGPRLGEATPKLGAVLGIEPKKPHGRSLPKVERCWSKETQMRCGREFSQIWANIVQVRSSSAKPGRMSPNFGRNRPNFGRSRRGAPPRVGRFRPRFGRNRSKLVERIPCFVDLTPKLGETSEVWSNMARLGSNTIRIG